jgi:AcrR family transcriptional regulator
LKVETASRDGRRYGGASAVERHADRRERLIRAAIMLYGEQGYRRTTVNAVCRAAGLTPRYFYEAFDNSEALLLATFGEVTHFVTQRVAAAADAAGGTPEDRLAALLTAYYDLLRDDPASARVFLLELSGIDPRVDALFAGSMAAFADLIADTLAPGQASDATEPLCQAGAMHGLLAVARDWVARGCKEPIVEVVRIAEPLCRMLVKSDSVA